MVAFTGFNENMVTFKCSGLIDVGSIVSITANGTVGVSSDSAVFSGIVRSVRDGYAAVQVSGYIEVPYTGTAPALGYTSVVANGDYGIKSGSGRNAIVVEVDTKKKTCGMLLI